MSEVPTVRQYSFCGQIYLVAVYLRLRLLLTHLFICYRLHYPSPLTTASRTYRHFFLNLYPMHRRHPVIFGHHLASSRSLILADAWLQRQSPVHQVMFRSGSKATTKFRLSLYWASQRQARTRTISRTQKKRQPPLPDCGFCMT